MSYEEEYKKARRRVQSFDLAGGRKDRELLTIREALRAGLRHPETGAAYDALYMLDTILDIRVDVRYKGRRG